jgi:hypothetical protein
LINVLSIRCGLAFAPYLEESAREFLSNGLASPRVVRQGGAGLIIRADKDLRLRFQNRESELDSADTRHFWATVAFRRESYDVRRMSDEVILGSVGNQLLLSHPQSEIWLQSGEVSSLLSLAQAKPGAVAGNEPLLPEWLSASTGAGRLLLSDQRTGRWVLLGSDHLSDIERRSHSLLGIDSAEDRHSPPTISVRGVVVHLQSAPHLAGALERFADSGEIIPYEEAFSEARLRVARSAEGIELTDGNVRAGMNAKDARKWASIIEGELDRLNVSQSERGRIRTTLAGGEKGRWILQWGDEIFVGDEAIENLRSQTSATADRRKARLVTAQIEGLMTILDRVTGSCVALDEEELAGLYRSIS